MTRTAIALICVALATPALGQGINPAVEGQGTQTQSLELVQGAISVTVESSGAISLGRGDDTLDGSLAVTVNDITIATTAASDPQDSGQHSGGASADDSKTPADTDIAVDQVIAGRTAPLATRDPATCNTGSVTAEDLTQALDQQFEVLLRPATCAQTASNMAQLVSSQPAFAGLLRQSGVDPDEVVSITIDNAAVIVDYQS